jgi:hypothetical protein
MARTVRAWIQNKVALVALASATVSGGCYSTGDGPEPAASALYFPVGLAVSPGGGALYVVNSDFDLQFNGGTIQVYDLPRLRQVLKPIWSPSGRPSVDDCGALGPNRLEVVQPGRCGPLDLSAPPDGLGSMVKGAVKIGAFATDLLFACQPGAAGGDVDCRGADADPRGARLFIPVRGEPSLTFVDVDDDRAGGTQQFQLDCGQSGLLGRCAETHRSGVNANDNVRGNTLPAEPFGIAINDDADAIVLTHQSGFGYASLFTAPSGSNVLETKPTLQYVIADLPNPLLRAPLTGIAAIPTPAVVRSLGRDAIGYQPGFAVTFRGSSEVDVLRVFDDAAAAPERPFLVQASRVGLSATPNGYDSRDVLIDHSAGAPRLRCERACAAGDLSCLDACARIPLAAYVANRSPASLLIGEVRNANPEGATDAVVVYDSEPLAAGPSRLVLGHIRNAAGEVSPRVFVLCFDAGQIFVYDPVARRIDGQIRTGHGPHSLVMDPIEPLAYVGHFTDSYIGVIDLDQLHTDTFETIVATIGVPQAPGTSK